MLPSQKEYRSDQAKGPTSVTINKKSANTVSMKKN